MENLKITFNLSSPAILNRYLTIDNLLLNAYFNKSRKAGVLKGFVEVEDYLDKLDWIEIKHGVLSGSIWYVENNPDKLITVNNIILPKKIDTKKMHEITGKKIDTSRGEFKAFKFGLEALVLDSIYFYVRGNKKIIEDLLKDVKYIGKKASIGFSKVKSWSVTEIEEDKSFMLNDTTPSKPLPCNRFDVKSKKIALYRPIPPYYKKDGIQPCYMPTRSLIERTDNTFDNPDFIALKDFEYKSAAEFARECFGDVSNVLNEYKDSKKYVKVKDNKDNSCIICGKIEKEGIIGNPKHVLPSTFNDYPFLGKGKFICSNCLWSMKNEKNLGNTFISPEEVYYLQGKNMKVKTAKEQQEFRDKFFRNLHKLNPPFLISLKSTANSQHTVFKNKVAISNAIVPISFGNEEEILIDVELLQEAINDMERIISENPCIKKPHLLNFEQINDTFPKLSKKCNNFENLRILSDFYKKYDSSIRKILNIIVIKRN